MPQIRHIRRGPKRRRSSGRRAPARDDAASEALLRLVDSEAQRLAHVGSWEWDVRRDVVRWSEELYRVYGVEPGTFDGTYEGFLARVYEPDRAATREIVDGAFKEGRSFEYAHRIVRPNGELRMLRTRGGAARGPDGAVTRLVGCCMDVTEQWLTQQRLDQSLSLLRATLDATADGIFVVDLEGRVVLCSRRAMDLWGIPEALAVHGDREAMIAHVLPLLKDPAGFAEKERRLFADLAYEGTDEIRFKDGRIFEHYSRPQTLGGRVVGRVCSFRDVTVRERALDELHLLAETLERRVQTRTAELKQRTEELRRSNAELEMFAAAASHDLSAPTRKIVSFAEILQRRAGAKLSPEEAKMLERIRASAADMVKLTADVLALSRMSREALPVADVPLSDVLRAALSDVELLLKKSGGTVDAGPLPVVRGHATLYRRLLQNLLGNALKFRAPGRAPRIIVRSRRLGDGSAELTVEDNGIGFEERFARAIFMPFRRLNPAHEYEGHGIGLTACERIVERYGGSISARAESGRGATFTVKLPPSAVARWPVT